MVSLLKSLCDGKADHLQRVGLLTLELLYLFQYLSSLQTQCLTRLNSSDSWRSLFNESCKTVSFVIEISGSIGQLSLIYLIWYYIYLKKTYQFCAMQLLFLAVVSIFLWHLKYETINVFFFFSKFWRYTKFSWYLYVAYCVL